MPSKWIQHVLAYQKEHNVTYKEAMSKAKSTYVKSVPKKKEKKVKKVVEKPELKDTSDYLKDV
jgi:hypothetical protein